MAHLTPQPKSSWLQHSALGQTLQAIADSTLDEKSKVEVAAIAGAMYAGLMDSVSYAKAGHSLRALAAKSEIEESAFVKTRFEEEVAPYGLSDSLKEQIWNGIKAARFPTATDEKRTLGR